jgi:Bifunctional DNA primase/polymerase, N-terminal
MNSAASGETDAASSQSEIDSSGRNKSYISPPSDDDKTILPAVLDYAARGFAVFPCLERDKRPAINGGFKAATTNPATIRRWFGDAFHRYNIAVATGLVSGIFILDVDGPDGAIALAQLESIHGPLPATLTSLTARGRHLWFRIDQPIPSSAGRIGPGLDGRGDGGYVLAPPSAHPEGPVYQWANDADLAPIPEWLAKLARRPVPTIRQMAVSSIKVPIGSFSAYGHAALEEECHAVATAIPGTRNHQLNRASFSLHQLVAGGELDQGEVYRGLIDAARACGLMEDDGPQQVDATINSGARAGLQNPRRRPA